MSTLQQLSQKSASSSSAFGLSVWMRQHPILAYFLLAFAITWMLHLPMVFSRNGLGWLPYEVPVALYAILFILGAFSGPTLGAFVVTNALEGKEGTRKLFRRYGQWRLGLPWYAIAIFGLPILHILAGSVALQGVPLADLEANWATFFSTDLPALLIFPALITWGEEPGWRGFALTRLQESYHPLAASVIVGFMHALWHLPVFLMVSGPIALGPFTLTGFASNTAVVIVLAILWTWVFNRARGSILIAVLLHASLNATPAWMAYLIPNYPESAGKIAIGFYGIAMAALLVMTKGRLGYASDSVEKTA
jgi:membrane protease YdiL (CAAX protease family)